MKKVILISALTTTLSLFCIESKAQFTFSVNPGIQLNSAGFGYKISKFVPFIGLQILSGSADLNEKGQRYDNSIGDFVSYEDKYKFSETLFMPTLGIKFFFIEKNKLKAYSTVCFTKFFLSGKFTDNTNATAGNEMKDIVKNTNLYGGQLGFGTEYFFDDNFSIGGEFGIRLLHLKYKNEVDDEVYNPNTGDDILLKKTYDYSFNLNPTFVKLSLNFYFGK
jgi:hypothetical protein